MKALFSHIVILFVICFFISGSSEKVRPTDEIPAYYEMGLKKLEAGNWNTAIHIWLQGIVKLQEKQIVDPRIGFSLISVVTQYSASEYYLNAQRGYYWAFNEAAFLDYNDEFRKEFEFIAPLMDSKLQKQLAKKLNAKDASAASDLLRFWEQQDPILTTEINERLIEHWERIAYIKNHFTDRKNTVFNTDDRGLIFVKYGAPRATYTGSLSYDNALLRSKASELIDILNPASNLNPTDSTASDFGASRAQVNKNVQTENLVQRVQQYYKNSKYEIWIYPPHEGGSENVVFIFGQNGDTGSFGLLKSVEDMIPSNAFGLRGDHARTSGITFSPGLMLQLLAYHELSHYDRFFLQKLEDLESRVYSVHYNNSSFLDVTVKNRNQFEMRQLQASLPPENSTLINEKPKIGLQVNYYRILDNDNNPRLLLCIFSDPHKALVYNWAQKVNVESKYNFNLFHSVKLISEHNREPVIQTDTASIYRTKNTESTLQLGARSLFLLPNIESAQNVITAELTDEDPALKSGERKIIGHGKELMTHPTPLDESYDELVVSDLILGYSKSESKDLYLPFLITSDNSIPEGSNLTIHFEVYHLRENRAGTHQFILDYDIKRETKGLSSLFKRKKTDVKLRLYFNASSNSFQEDLEVKTSKFKAGKYLLTMKVTDLTDNRTFERTAEFEIREK